ncbi:MAG: long-chain N-acyl amino acid synthase, partial [Nitrosospira sp.]
LSYIYARSLHNADDAFIEVNPRHASFYKRMLGFRQISGINTCKRVDAPAVLMHLDLEYVDAKIASLADPYKYKDRSLYSYFFSRREEEGLAAKLRRHIN